jgi:hypothetical protein
MKVRHVLKNIKAEHVFAALLRFELGEKAPKNRRATKYCLKMGRRHYPPKWVLRLASEEAGTPLRKSLGLELFGGPMTNDTFKKLGFSVGKCSSARLHEKPF